MSNPFTQNFDKGGTPMEDINLDFPGYHPGDLVDPVDPTLDFDDDLEGNMSSIDPATGDRESLLQEGVQGGVRPVQAPGGMCSCFSIAYYQPYFNVSTADVRKRILLSLLAAKPENRKFFSVVQNNPDIYGPFWLCTTLVFTIAASANFASWMSFVPSSAHPYWSYDFNLVLFATSLIYGFTFGVPIALWFVLKYLGHILPLDCTICLYGYSIAVFIPTCLLCVVPSHLLDWGFVLLALAVSCGFVVGNLHPRLMEPLGKQLCYRVLGGVVGAHTLLAVILKYYFFRHTSI